MAKSLTEPIKGDDIRSQNMNLSEILNTAWINQNIIKIEKDTTSSRGMWVATVVE